MCNLAICNLLPHPVSSLFHLKQKIRPPLTQVLSILGSPWPTFKNEYFSNIATRPLIAAPSAPKLPKVFQNRCKHLSKVIQFTSKLESVKPTENNITYYVFITSEPLISV